MTPREMFGIEPENVYWIVVDGGLRQLAMTFEHAPTAPQLPGDVACGCKLEEDGDLYRLEVCEGHARLLT